MTTQVIKNPSPAFAYFITLRTYATWLHGDERESVDPKRNQFNTPRISSNSFLLNAMKNTAKENPFLLDESMRKTVLKSMVRTAQCLNWKIFAIHVRTNHVHLVIQSDFSTEITAKKLKRYATIDLKKYHCDISARHKIWSRHASTKMIWRPESLFPVLYYVIKQQGEPMALYYDKSCYNTEAEEIYECYFDDR